MSTVASTPGRGVLRPLVRAALVVLPGIVGLVLAPGAGWAANGLTSATPADSSALATAPDAVLLTFSAPPDVSLSHVSTRDTSQREVGTGEPARAGRTGLRLPVSIRYSGDYTIAYHVVFEDGSDIVGVLRFSVGTGVPPPRPDGAQARQAEQAVTAGHDHGVDPLSGSLLVADVVVLVGVLVLLKLRRKPTDRKLEGLEP